jgi:hypothetical protein
MSKVYLVTDPQPRAQVALGDFAPHPDTNLKQHGVMFAAVSGKSHFPHIGEAVNNGIRFGQQKQHRVLWDEFKDRDGKPHDVTLASGAVVRQLVCPKEVLDKKTRMEAQDSTDMCAREKLLTEEQLKARAAADQYASRQIQELTLGESEIQRIPTEHEQMPPASTSAAKPRTDNLAKARAAKAAKRAQAQPQPQT